MSRILRTRSSLLALTICLTSGGAAWAQATRTWVSGVGNDANPCSRTAPCKTYAGAISKTAAGGEISTLDPGGFGAVTITKSITIDGGGGQVASILASLVNGIIINAGASDVITLRNLRINGAGNGINGIRFLAGAGLVVENCQIHGFATSGISIAPSAGGRFVVNKCTLSNNAAGIIVNGNSGGAAAVIKIAVTETKVVHGSGNAINAVSTAGHSPINFLMNKSEARNYNGIGVQADGPNTGILIGDSAVSGNGTGASQINGGTIGSYKNNVINANGADGTPLTAVPLN